jgi:hypothetical protein
LRKPRITLLYLVVGLSVFSAAVAFANALFAAYTVQKEQLVATTLEGNRAYAVKLAEVVDLYVGAIQQQLKASARRVGKMMDAPAALDEEVLRVAEQSDGVIAAAVVDAKGHMLAFASLLPGAESQSGTASGVDLRGAAQAGNVTPPYLSSQGLWTVALTEPVRVPGLCGRGALLATQHRIGPPVARAFLPRRFVRLCGRCRWQYSVPPRP